MVQIRSFLLTMVLAIGLLFSATTAFASGDKVELTDGRVLQGTIIQEMEGYVWIRATVGGITSEMMLKPSEIKSVTRSADGGAAEMAAAAKSEPTKKARVDSGATRAAIITLGEGGDKDMVGLYMTAASLERALPMLEEEKVEVVVLLINSGGGALLEIKRISDFIEFELKPRFRVVAWIESAISAAAMIAHTVEEIYFMPAANYGACTGYSGALHAIKGRELEEVLYLMEQISDRGKHNRAIMRSMQIMDPLSATIDEHGDVHWANSLDGQHVVNPRGRVLTLTAHDAVKFRFARGIAATHHELAKLMGYNEIVWVGREVSGVAYPVSRAEESVRRFRNQTHEDVRRTDQHLITYATAVGAAAGMPRDERGPFLGRAQRALDAIDQTVRNNPNVSLFVFNALQADFREWMQEQRDLLRRLRQR